MINLKQQVMDRLGNSLLPYCCVEGGKQLAFNVAQRIINSNDEKSPNSKRLLSVSFHHHNVVLTKTVKF